MRVRLHYLTSHEAAVDGNAKAKEHPMHLISFNSSTMTRVCRASLQCEAPTSMGTAYVPASLNCLDNSQRVGSGKM